MNRLRCKQRGAILILILACMAIASVLLILGVQFAVSIHRTTRTFGWSVQAQCLAQSGLERAAAKLAADADYPGETWKIPAEELGGDYAAILKIEVKPMPDKTGRHVKVQAEFPDDPLDRVLYDKELTLELQ
jgi:hypothetical protein